MYTLDFETMKQIMREHKKTGFLTANVSSDFASRHEACRIEIILKAGSIISCALVGKSGWSLTGKEAEEELARLEQLRLSWTFTPQLEGMLPPESPKPPTPVIGANVAFPRRTNLQVQQGQIQNWPRIHRGVLRLADGTKNVVKMAEILSTTPDLVDQALWDLQSMGLITTDG